MPYTTDAILKSKMLLRNLPQAWIFAATLVAMLLTSGLTLAQTGRNDASTGFEKPNSDSPATVLDLSTASRFMLINDHTFRAAISEQAASQTERAKGRAGLLPTIQFSYSHSRVSGSRWQQNFRGQRIESDLSYNSNNGYVQLRQPLLDYGRYAGYQRGHALADRGNANFSVRQQEAGLRVTDSYFNVLLAYDSLALQESLTASLADMVKALQAKFRQSEASRTEVQETEARLSLARADAIAAKDRLTIATRELQSVIGLTPVRVAALRADFPLPPLVPAGLDDWLARARLQNPEVRAAQEALNVAETDVEQAGSRYLPTLNLVASYGHTNSDSLSSIDQRTNTFTVGLQLDIPLFTGGYTTANVARARADRARLQYELNATQERTQAEVTRLYTDVRGGADRIRALEAAVKSGSLALDAARKGFLAGTQSNIDVLNTQDKLYQARSELTRARIDYLKARLALAASVGDLQTGVFDEINTTYLAPVVVVSTN